MFLKIIVEMEEDLHFHVMMEAIIMEMAALLTVGCNINEDVYYRQYSVPFT